MRHHVLIHIGGCGLGLGLRLWKEVFAEHGVGADGQLRAGALSDEGAFLKRVAPSRVAPRAVVVDGDPSSIDLFKDDPVSGLFRADNFVFGGGACGNNWAMGYNDRVAMRDAAVARVTSEISPAGGSHNFIITHALGGGTGGGLGAAIVEKLRLVYPSSTIVCFSVLSSPSQDDVVVRPYNEVLALAKLIANANAVVLLDNESLGLAARARFGENAVHHARLNELAAQALALLTSPLRLPETRAVELRELTRTLTPFRGLALVSLAIESWTDTVGGDLVDALRSRVNRVRGHGADTSALLSAAFIAPRGRPISPTSLRADARLGFRGWFPDPLVLRTRSRARAIAMASSESGVVGPLSALCSRFDSMLKRKAFLHWYHGHGLTTSQMQQARKAVGELIAAYQTAANS